MHDPASDQSRSLKAWLGDQGFREYIATICHGLQQARGSGERTFALQQLRRAWAPVVGILVPALLVVLTLYASARTPPEPDAAFICVLVAPPEAPPVLEPEAPPPPDAAPLIPPEPLPDLPAHVSDALHPGPLRDEVPGAATVTAEPAVNTVQPLRGMDNVAPIKSVVQLQGIFRDRRGDGRADALARGNGGGAGGTLTEQAVYRALRWLKTHQSADGSWAPDAGGGPDSGARAAFTGLALLAFLAHGETPEEAEFGPTVQRAIEWLLANQTDTGDFKFSDANNYSQPICTYALCEAFALTQIPMVRKAAEKSVRRIITGQNPAGNLWNYNFNPTQELKQPGERNDLSFGGWCMQALEAASAARVQPEGLEETMQRALQGMRRAMNAGADGASGWGYAWRAGERDDPSGPLTAAGALSMQLMGAGTSREVGRALLWLKRVDCNWATPWSANPIYHWYYTTQVKFHAGGQVWADWERRFSPQVVASQVVIAGGAHNAKGEPVDIGFWKAAGPKEHCQSYVYNTTLCALMLEVYYRHRLDTDTPPEAIAVRPGAWEDRDQEIGVEVL